MSNTLENEYHPDTVSPPGGTLLETLRAIGMTQGELAQRTGRPLKTINEIVNGKTAITPETALQLERVLGIPARFWNNRESLYREYLARRAEAERLRKGVDWLKSFPLQAMVKLGWVRRRETKVEQIQEILDFFAVVSPDQWQEVYCGPKVACRRSRAFESNPVAVAAWLRRGQIEVREISVASYSQTKFRRILPDLRALTVREPEFFEPELIRLCASCGVAVAFVPELPKTRLCGAACWLGSEKALIQLSLRHKSDDHLWFTFFHEAAHILLHGKRRLFIDAEDDVSTEEEEQEANRFASDLLIPPAQLHRFRAATKAISAAAIRCFASEIGIAPGIVVGRLQHDGLLPHSDCNHLKRRFEFARETSNRDREG
jgi:HTH-type transcriptional regulator/antitoxin HigA